MAHYDLFRGVNCQASCNLIRLWAVRLCPVQLASVASIRMSIPRSPPLCTRRRSLLPRLSFTPSPSYPLSSGPSRLTTFRLPPTAPSVTLPGVTPAAYPLAPSPPSLPSAPPKIRPFSSCPEFLLGNRASLSHNSPWDTSIRSFRNQPCPDLLLGAVLRVIGNCTSQHGGFAVPSSEPPRPAVALGETTPSHR